MRKIRVVNATLAALFFSSIVGAMLVVAMGCTNGQPTAQTAQAVNTAFAVADVSLAVYQQAADDAHAALDLTAARIKADPANAALQATWVKQQRTAERAEATLTQFKAYLSLAKALTPLLVSPPQVIAPPSTQPAK